MKEKQNPHNCMLDPYNREIVLRHQLENLKPLAIAAADELLQCAKEIMDRHTSKNCEWPDEEYNAKAEYERLIILAKNLKEAASVDRSQQYRILCQCLKSRHAEGTKP